MVYEITKDRFDYAFRIRLELNGGTCETDGIDAVVGEEIGELPMAVKGQMVCTGWYYDSSFTVKAKATDKADMSRATLYPMFVKMTNYTQFTFTTTSAGQEAGIYAATKKAGADSIIVDWGDGTVEVFSDSIRQARHAYASAGKYYVKVSDSACEIAPSSEDSSWSSNGSISYRLTAVNAWSTSVTKIPESAFRNTSITSFSVPATVTEMGAHPLIGCTKLLYITVDAGNQVFDSRNKCNAIIRTVDDYLVSGCQKTVIPNTVKTIGRGSFRQIPNLGDFAIPEGVETIEPTAFSDSGVTRVTLPSSVTRIGANSGANDSVFSGSTLTGATIRCSGAEWGVYVFLDC